MLYNTERKKVITRVDCLRCEHYNHRTGDCDGLNTVCFEYDPRTKTAIDGVTHLPIRAVEEDENDV